MDPTLNNYLPFIKAVATDQTIGINRQGRWYKEGLLWRVVRWLVSWIDQRECRKVAKVFNRAMEHFERHPDVQTPRELDEAFSSLKNRIGDHKVLSTIAHRITALQTRVGVDLAGIELLAEDWAKDEELYNRGLIKEEKETLQEIQRYPAFSSLITQDTYIRHEFFKWALRDDGDVETFVRHPAVAHRLKVSLLSNRMGRFHHKHLTADGNPINLLDESALVNFTNGYNLTVKEVMDIFGNKNANIGNLEYFEGGITNWNAHELGPWNPDANDWDRIQVEEPLWWNQIPRFETLDTDAVENRFGVRPTSGQWVAVAASTRMSIDHDLDRCHGYMVVVIPGANDTYSILPMGKFARDYPQTMMDKVTFLADTVDAVVAIPDENAYHGLRQKAMIPFLLTGEQGQSLMDLVKKDILRARERDFFFQFTWEGCANWPQTLLEQVVEHLPNLYFSPGINTYPSDPLLGRIFHSIRYLPLKWQPKAIAVVARALGAHRGKKREDGTVISVATTPFMDHAHIYYPGFLHIQIENGTLPGSITFGHAAMRGKTWPSH